MNQLHAEPIKDEPGKCLGERDDASNAANASPESPGGEGNTGGDEAMVVRDPERETAATPASCRQVKETKDSGGADVGNDTSRKRPRTPSGVYSETCHGSLPEIDSNGRSS